MAVPERLGTLVSVGRGGGCLEGGGTRRRRLRALRPADRDAAGPETDDYAEVIRNAQATVAEHHGAIVGIIVLTVTDKGFLVDNVAVHPSHRGTGLGRALLEFAEAEARRAGFDALYLYTHEQLTENLALYARIGYVEYDRRSQGAFSLVYLRKHLG